MRETFESPTMKKTIPTLEQFRRDITAIFIDEEVDYNYVLGRVRYHLDESQPDNDPLLTYETLLQKYRDHINLWNLRNGEKERKGFIDKIQLRKRKNILDFLESRLYSIDWGNTSVTPLRDDYLFGNRLSQKELMEQLNDFKKSCKEKPH
jgi:hypothetical protein